MTKNKTKKIKKLSLIRIKPGPKKGRPRKGSRDYLRPPVKSMRNMYHDGGKPIKRTDECVQFRANPRSEPGVNTRTELHPAPWVYRRDGHYRIKMIFRVPSGAYNAISQGHITIMQLWSGPEGNQKVLAGVSINADGAADVFVNGTPDQIIDSINCPPGRWVTLEIKFGLHKDKQYYGTLRHSVSGANLIPRVAGYDYFRPKFGLYAPSTGVPLGVDFKLFQFHGDPRGVIEYDVAQ